MTLMALASTLTSLDLDPYASSRSLDVMAGDLFDLGLHVDLLVVSTYEGFYEGLPGSMVAQLRQRCGIDIASLQKSLDLRGAPLIRGWISDDLDSDVNWSKANTRTRFRRLAIIESPRDEDSLQEEWPAFNQLFCLLALLPLSGIHCPSVASPLLSAGNHGIKPNLLFPPLLARRRDRLKHLPDLERLVIFDRNHSYIRQLAEHVNKEAKRNKSYTADLTVDDNDLNLKALRQSLMALAKLPGGINTENIQKIDQQLSEGVIRPVVLGTFIRRLVENLAQVALGSTSSRPSLNLELKALSHEYGCDPWIMSCLHQIRVYGNWMVHEQPLRQGSRASSRTVMKEDVVMVLMALQRALDAYPWIRPGRGRPSRPKSTAPSKTRKAVSPIQAPVYRRA